MQNNIFLFLKGIIMGIANVIPGVSGGTLAVSFNIFDELIGSINNLFKDLKGSLKFLIPLFLGMGFGIVVFSSAIEFGLTNYAFSTTMLFVGLIVGSIPLIYGKATEKGYGITDFIIAVIVFLGLCFLATKSEVSDNNTEYTVNLAFFIKFFIIGAIASSAMIIPGISGSFILMVLGVYNIIILSVSNLTDYLKDITNFSILFDSLYVLVPTGLGIVVGVLLVSKVIGFLLEKSQTKLYFIVLGLIFGSIFSMFYNPSTYESGFDFFGIVLGVALFALGAIIAKKLGGNK